MSNMVVTADMVRHEIEFLLAQYPELKDDEDLRADMLEGETRIGELLTACLRYREDTRALVEGTSNRLEELAARKARFKLRIEFITKLMATLLDTAQLKKIELPEGTLTMRNNPQQLLGDPDPATLPDDLCKISREPDRKKIREALLAGTEVEGFVLNNAPPSLMVRVK